MINTFDVDYERLDNGLISDSTSKARIICEKISSLPCCELLEIRDSASGNGYHIKIKCKINGCDKCRLVFDSPPRYNLDLERPLYSQNVLWAKKTYTKGGKHIIGEAGPWKTY